MSTAHIGQALRAKQGMAGLSTSELANRAGCAVAEVHQVLAGDPDARLGVVAAVSAALGCELVALTQDQVVEHGLERLQDVAAGRVTHGGEPEGALRSPDVVSQQGSPAAAEVGVSRAAMEELRREERRLALHEAAVRILESHPARVETVRKLLERWTAAGFPNRELAEDWRCIIETRNWGAMLERSDQGRCLRKGSPLACVLDQEERLQILRDFGGRRGSDG